MTGVYSCQVYCGKIGNTLRSIEREFLTIQDIALFFECRQVYDPDSGLRHPTNININKLSEVKLPNIVFKYQRMREYLDTRGV